MKKLNIILILLFTCSWAYAQNREVYPQQVSIDHNQAVQRFSSDYVTMQSSRAEDMAVNAGDATNLASFSIAGLHNLFSLSQNGLSNNFFLSINGSKNEGDFEQDGNNNLINIDLIGSHNSFGVRQKGNYNVYESSFEINSQSLGTLTQLGNFQNAQVSGQNGIPLSITQTGQGASIIISNY